MTTATAARPTGALSAGSERKTGTTYTSLRRALTEYREYLDTLDELRSLSDRQLTDLGMVRGDLKRVAWAAATAE